MPEVDAPMLEQIVGRFRLRVRLEIRGRAHDGRPMVLRHPDRDHVLLNVFAEVNSCIEASCNDVEAAVVSGDIENDVRIIARKLRQFRSEHSRSGKPRHEQAHAARGFVA